MIIAGPDDVTRAALAEIERALADRDRAALVEALARGARWRSRF